MKNNLKNLFKFIYYLRAKNYKLKMHKFVLL